MHVSHHLVPAGTVAALVSAGGGGWGSPLDRDPERVLADVIDGLVTVEAAAEHYGVVVCGTAIDQRATEERRQSLRAESKADEAKASRREEF